MSKTGKWGSRIAVGTLTVVAFIIVMWGEPAALSFLEITKEGVFRILALLFVIALFLERALEVYVTAWRESETAEKAAAVRKEERILASLEQHGADDFAAELNTRYDSIEEAEKKLAASKSKTRRATLTASMCVGVLVSAAGVRTLANMVDPNALAGVGTWQRAWFALTDVLLTGGLLAGGSDGIHRIVKTFTDFMDATSERLQK